MFTVKRSVDELGRIVLPRDMRDHYGVKAGDSLEVIATEDGILIKIPSGSNTEQH